METKNGWRKLEQIQGFLRNSKHFQESGFGKKEKRMKLDLEIWTSLLGKKQNQKKKFGRQQPYF